MIKKTLILGLGNDILKDDSIGLRLVIDLARYIDFRDFHCETTSSGGMEILELIRDFDKVIIIDAIRARNSHPGDVYYFTPSSLKNTSHLLSFHDIDFLTALQLGKALTLDLPEDIHIIAIEIAEDMEF